ncbi:shikimate kinase [Leucobacter denitrificans]|uniref:Shikimate kinase n=1 Tax=Leucobacter denitrificans TaxID=683042 RepID=A0A7G9S5I5_9MICO|nr:shikimate kinase [Leucobacter denitrificans]QNN63110.1 shikimate kinase [Leucobacter denitrificans]
MIASRRAARQAGPPVTAPKPAPPTHRVLPVGEESHTHNPTEVEASKKAKQRRKRRRRGASRVPDRAIVFVGPMAAGKTSLGRRVAKELAVPFVDSDVLFVREHGAITDFFAAHGEPEFRRIEAEIIAAELAKPGTKILALGGGAVLTESTRQLLAQYPTILLMTTQDAVLRTANLSRRPLLRDDPSAWGRILAERKPLYLEVANVTFRTDRAGKEQLTKRVVQWVKAYGRKERANARRSTTERGREVSMDEKKERE